MSDIFPPVVIQKTPASKFDIQIDWAEALTKLGGDTISSSTWAIETSDGALVLSAAAIGSPATTTTIWVDAGTVNVNYTITNTIITAGGRKLPESFIVSVVSYIYIDKSTGC